MQSEENQLSHSSRHDPQRELKMDNGGHCFLGRRSNVSGAAILLTTSEVLMVKKQGMHIVAGLVFANEYRRKCN
jgi:hypothetical protein